MDTSTAARGVPHAAVRLRPLGASPRVDSENSMREAVYGWVLGFRSGVGVVLILLMVPVLIARIRAEEALLRDQFGAEYEAYRAKTWRMVPGIY